MGGFCRDDGTEMADHFLVHIEHKVKPTDAQKAAFEELKSATRAAAEKMKAGCPQVASANAQKDGPKPAQSPIERVDRAQARLEASLDAIKTVRPAAEKSARRARAALVSRALRPTNYLEARSLV